MATRNTNTTTKAAAKAAKAAAALAAPVAAPVNPFAVAMAQVAKRGAATATAAAKGVQSTTQAPAVGNVAPVGVATRNAGKAATMPGFALVGVNGRKQAYTGQTKGAPVLTVAQLQALAAPVTPA